MKKCLLFSALLLCISASWSQNDFAHGFSGAGGESGMTANGSVSYTFGMPFFSEQANTESYSLNEGVMHSQLIRVNLELEGCQNDAVAVSPAHVKDTSGFFKGYEGIEKVFRGETIHVFPAGTYDSTGYDALHYTWDSQYHYDSLTTLLLKVYPIYEIFDTLYLDSTDIVTDYARNVLLIPDDKWHQLHGGPNVYELQTAEHGCDSVCHFFVNLCGGVVKDADGNEYNSLYVGNAPLRFCWTKPNMKTTAYISGGQVPNMIYNADMHNDEAANLNTYGRLYNWYAAVNLPDGSNDLPSTTTNGGFVTGICPKGWHIPTSANIESLVNLDASNMMADILWLIPGNDTGNGFYALPAGYYSYKAGRFEDMLGMTSFWSSVKHSPSEIWVCSLLYGCNKIIKDNISIDNGLSVRCVKNQIFDDSGNELND